MKASVVLATTLMLAPVLGGAEILTNDTGGTVHGLVVVFQEPVTITSSGESLPLVEPEAEVNCASIVRNPPVGLAARLL